MDALTALYTAQARRVGIRRPSMPEGVLMVPVLPSVETGGMQAFLISPGQGAPWSPTLEDVQAMDWYLADWRGACG